MKYSLIRFFFFVLMGTMFFDDPHLYYYKRVIYIIFLVLSTWQLYLFHSRNRLTEGPAFYSLFIKLFIAFVIYNLLVDLRNPTLSIVTLLNHPVAVLAVIPVFAFRIGYQTSEREMEKFFTFLFWTCCLFCLLFAFPLAGKNVYTPSLACSCAVIPLFLFSWYRKKYLFFPIVLLVVSFAFSQVSESRTVILRILLFFGLLTGLHLVKKWSPLKILIILATGFMIFQFLTNLETWLGLFKQYAGMKSFDDDDTRTFLYEELFGDMKSRELILGRGFLGTYFSEYFLIQMSNNDASGDFYFRFTVEVGFLQLLLKGGFLYYLLYITPLVATCYKGLFTAHKSGIAFSIAVYVLCELFIMFIENMPAWHFQYFLLFFLAGYAYRRTSTGQTVASSYFEKNNHIQLG